MALSSGKLGTAAKLREPVVRMLVGAGAARLIVGLKSLCFIYLLVNYYGSESYGAVSQIIVVGNLLWPVIALRLDSAIVRYLPQSAEDRAVFLKSILVTVAAATLIATVVISQLGSQVSSLVFGSQEQASYALILALWISIAALHQLVCAVPRAMREFGTYSLYVGAKEGGEIIVLAICALAGLSLESMLWSVIGYGVSVTALIWLRTLWNTGASVALSQSVMAQCLRFSAPLIPHGILYYITISIARFILVSEYDLETVSVYAAAYSVSMLFVLPLAPISLVMLPALLRWSADEAQLRESARAWVLLLVAAACPAAIVTAFVLPVVLERLAGELYVTPLWVGGCIVVAALLTVFDRALRQLLHVYEKTRYIIMVSCAVTAFSVPANLLLIPAYGIGGAALALMISAVLSACAYVFIMSRVNASILSPGLAVVLGVSAVTVSIGTMLNFGDVESAIISSILVVLVYVLLMGITLRAALWRSVLIVRSGEGELRDQSG